MFNTAIILGLVAALGIVLLGACLSRLRQRRAFAAVRSGLSGSCCLALAALGIALGLNLYTYHRLSHEQPVAELYFVALGDQHFRAVLDTPHNPRRQFDLKGDQWQIDARVLKWAPAANLLGFDALYRLERLSGRYTDIAAERSQPRSVYTINPAERGLSTWSLARRLPRWARFVDAEYGSATYLPMADKARYRITISQSGLVVRPQNRPALEAVRHW